MPNGVSLKSVMFATFPDTVHGSLAHVQFNLTHGESSPVFSSLESKAQHLAKVISFENKKKVSCV